MSLPLAKTYLLGYPVHLTSIPEAVADVTAFLNQPGERTYHVVTLNPEMLMQGEKDPALGKILKHAELVLPDGAGVVWALRRGGQAEVTRLPGIEFSEALLKRAAEAGYTVALIGASPEVNETAVEALQGQYPGLRIVFANHGFFHGELDEATIAQDCAETSPDLVFVALGVPRQEFWIERYRPLFQTYKNTVLVGVGGSFDVWAGAVTRAPALFRTLNLEWLYRFIKQPWRIQRAGQHLLMFVVRILLADSKRDV